MVALSPFTEEKSEASGLSNLPNFIESVSDSVGINTQVVLILYLCSKLLLTYF